MDRNLSNCYFINSLHKNSRIDHINEGNCIVRPSAMGYSISLMADILCKIKLRVKRFYITNQKYCGINTWSCSVQYKVMESSI